MDWQRGETRRSGLGRDGGAHEATASGPARKAPPTAPPGSPDRGTSKGAKRPSSKRVHKEAGTGARARFGHASREVVDAPWVGVEGIPGEYPVDMHAWGWASAGGKHESSEPGLHPIFLAPHAHARTRLHTDTGKSHSRLTSHSRMRAHAGRRAQAQRRAMVSTRARASRGLFPQCGWQWAATAAAAAVAIAPVAARMAATFARVAAPASAATALPLLPPQAGAVPVASPSVLVVALPRASQSDGVA